MLLLISTEVELISSECTVPLCSLNIVCVDFGLWVWYVNMSMSCGYKTNRNLIKKDVQALRNKILINELFRVIN